MTIILIQAKPHEFFPANQLNHLAISTV